VNDVTSLKYDVTDTEIHWRNFDTMRNTVRKANDQVLNSMLTLALCTCIVSAFIIKCTPLGPKKPIDPRTEISMSSYSSSSTFDQSEIETEIENFRMESALKIAGYEQLISDMRLKNSSDANRESELKKLLALEEKNNELKKQITLYEYNGEKNWEKFKYSFNRQLKQMVRGFNEISELTK
jgi:hypothetical protein